MWELNRKENWAAKNCCFWTEKTLENPLDCKGIQPVYPKGNQSWIFIGRTNVKLKHNTLATWRRTDSFEKILMLGKIEGRRRRGWQRIRDGWMASPTQWTWVWTSSGSWQWTGKPGVLQSMGSQIVGHDWATELNWTEDYIFLKFLFLQTNAALEYTFTLKTKKVQSVIISPPEKTNYIYIDRLQEFLLYKYTYACMLSHIHAPCDPVDCSSPGSSVHGIFQARILEWIAMPSSRGSSWPRDWTPVSMSPSLAGRFFTTSATWEVQSP